MLLGMIRPKRFDATDFDALKDEEIWSLNDSINYLVNIEFIADGGFGRAYQSDRLKNLFMDYARWIYDCYLEKKIIFYSEQGVEGEPLDESVFIVYGLAEDPDEIAFDISDVHVTQDDFLRVASASTDYSFNMLLIFLNNEKFKKYPEQYLLERYKKGTGAKAVKAKWSKYRAPMVDRVKEYILMLLEKGCVCDHAQVKDHAYKRFQNDDVVKLATNAVKNRLGEDFKKHVHKYLTKDNLKEISRDIFEKRGIKRIYKVDIDNRRKDCPADHE